MKPLPLTFSPGLKACDEKSALWDTDMDLLFFTENSQTTRYGIDFAGNGRIKSVFLCNFSLIFAFIMQ